MFVNQRILKKKLLDNIRIRKCILKIRINISYLWIRLAYYYHKVTSL